MIRRLLLLVVVVTLPLFGCGTTPPDPMIDPNAIDILVLVDGSAGEGRSVMLISSDGMVQNVATGANGHAIAMLGPHATQATVYFDSASAKGHYLMQGVVPGDHICLGCAYTTTGTTCPGVPQITNLHRVNDGWFWTIGPGAAYAGMEISWLPNASMPTTGGHLISPPGSLSASTSNSADITIVLFTRDDVVSYDDLRSLSQDDWAKTAFCTSSAHGQ